MKGIKVDGMDPVATYLAAKEAVGHARRGDGPVLLECVTFRTLGHVLSDKNEYMDPDVLAEQIANDPVPRFRARVLAEGVADEAALAAIDQRVADEVESSYTTATAEPDADPAQVTGDTYGPVTAAEEPGEDDEPNQRLTFRNAINQAMDQALANDERVFVMGEDVADSAGGGVFHVTDGLSTTHGEHRVRNTPISEEAIMGAGVGAAVAGMRPLVEIMFMDFLGVAWDQLANHAAKLRYMSGGRTPVPLTVRVNMVGGTPIGAQHSQSLEALLMHTPGLKVVFPSTPYDAKGLLLACIEDEDPCVFIESTALFMKRGMVPEAPYTIPIGKAAIRREGSDVDDHLLRPADERRAQGRRRSGRRRHLRRGHRPALAGAARHADPARLGGQDEAGRGRARGRPHMRGGCRDRRPPPRGAAQRIGRAGAPSDRPGLVGAGAGRPRRRVLPQCRRHRRRGEGVMTATDTTAKGTKGAARSPGLSYQQLLDTDTHEVPERSCARSRPRSSATRTSRSTTTSAREWHELEKERLWSRVWQFACREEHIPSVGDHIRLRDRRAVVS